MNNNLYNGFISQQDYDKYVENYLKRHLGNKVEAYASFNDSHEWRDKIFNGILKDVGKDYIVIDNQDFSYLIWNVYLDYIIFKN